MNFFLIGIIVGVVMLIALTFVKKDGPFAKLGVNLKRTYCPNCNAKQPIVRKPANQRQAMFGGHTCKECGTEMDKYGTEVSSE